MDSVLDIMNTKKTINLAKDVIHLYIRPADQMEASGIAKEYLLLFEQQERERLHSYLVEFKKKEYLLGRGLIKTVLARYLNKPPKCIRLEIDKYGKPHLPTDILPPGQPPIQFNLSHSKNIIALALTQTDTIGVDVEYVDQECIPYQDIAKSFFTEEERGFIFSHDNVAQSQAFFQVWTLKESYIKAIGHGLSIPLTSFNVPLFDLHGGMEGWKFYCFRDLVPNYWVSLALGSSTPKKVILQ